MRITISASLIMILFGVIVQSCMKVKTSPPRVLVFTKTAGFHHSSIPDGVRAILDLGNDEGIIVDTTSNSMLFNEDSLNKYSAIIFLNTTGDVLNMKQQKDFERYIQAGGGYVGIHAAADCEYHWPWYGELVGAYFKSHPKQQEATLIVERSATFPVLDSFPRFWSRKDEWYNFHEPPVGVNVLISLDENSYEGGEMKDDHPIVWYHNFDGGRSFYIGLGHTSESYKDPYFLDLLKSGIQYAIGKNKVLDYSKATSLRQPDESRFTRRVLTRDIQEPTEMAILPDLNILVAEWRGDIKYYNAADNTTKTVAHINVGHDGGEFGLLGMQIDPDYEETHWIYLYYSPADSAVDRLSRFKFEDHEFDLESEEIILEVETRRGICCHTGGSIAFDRDKNLYLSTGDNTTPFDEVDSRTDETLPINTHGFAPLDDRTGFEPYDDRRAAGNSNDLRGKILRIKVNQDGSYSIPQGNLYAKGTPRTRPEIYVQGARNPYRISVDKHTGYLYWGDVGPDANDDSLDTRGPRGYDEINQAREAGNFGWPFFVGDNYPYREYNYSTGQSGLPFDPETVINDSKNNTGIRELPPAQPAFIWYPYGESPDFPIVGTGGRTAMAGPVYYVKDYPEANRLPQYYDGKLFIYDWIRGWIMVVTMNETGDLQTIEQFMPHTEFNNISDMEMGGDGQLYIVEYGKKWYSKNPEAALSVISYNEGNRPPVAKLKVVSRGDEIPETIVFSSEGSYDPDDDKMSFYWDFGDGKDTVVETPEVSHTFDIPGEYVVFMEVTDDKGGKTRSNDIRIVVEEVARSNDSSLPPGEKIMRSMDCRSCHQTSSESTGPSFLSIMKRYKSDKDSKELLVNKIINGGSGNWGQRVMPGHPNLIEEDAKEIVTWIMSITND